MLATVFPVPNYGLLGIEYLQQAWAIAQEPLENVNYCDIHQIRCSTKNATRKFLVCETT